MSLRETSRDGKITEETIVTQAKSMETWIQFSVSWSLLGHRGLSWKITSGSLACGSRAREPGFSGGIDTLRSGQSAPLLRSRHFESWELPLPSSKEGLQTQFLEWSSWLQGLSVDVLGCPLSRKEERGPLSSLYYLSGGWWGAGRCWETVSWVWSLWGPRNVFSGRLASSGPGAAGGWPPALREPGIHIVFTPHNGVPGSPRHLSLCFWGHCDQDCWEPAPLWNQRGIILEGLLMGWILPWALCNVLIWASSLGPIPALSENFSQQKSVLSCL